MPWPVYSERFINLDVQDTWATYYVPSRKRAIVRSVVVVNWTTVPAFWQMTLNGWPAFLSQIQAAYETVAYSTALVCYAGDEIACAVNEPDMHLNVSGHLLDAPDDLLRDDLAMQVPLEKPPPVWPPATPSPP
jgi:hypothetical protein